MLRALEGKARRLRHVVDARPDLARQLHPRLIAEYLAWLDAAAERERARLAEPVPCIDP